MQIAEQGGSAPQALKAALGVTEIGGETTQQGARAVEIAAGADTVAMEGGATLTEAVGDNPGAWEMVDAADQGPVEIVEGPVEMVGAGGTAVALL